jgi:ribosomal protein S18 acetylase RimI-like enzyme
MGDSAVRPDELPPGEVMVAECADLPLARRLFGEYLHATIAETGLPDPDGSPAVLAAMRREIERLPGPYAAPHGALLVASRADTAVGSAGLARIDEHRAEIRRLWVRPEARRRGVARDLTNACLLRAAALGYAQVVLDVVPSRVGAIALYRSLGFREIQPYDDYPFEMVFMGRSVPEA